jgi:hypothetical protein
VPHNRPRAAQYTPRILQSGKPAQTAPTALPRNASSRNLQNKVQTERQTQQWISAFGRNGSMTVLDPVALSNIDRFKEVNVTATRPEDVLNPEWIPSYQFLRQLKVKLKKHDHR